MEAMGFGYWQGDHLVDDRELYKFRIDRFYDVYADEMEYRKMEGFIGEFTEGLDPDYAYSLRECLYLFGKFLNEKGLIALLQRHIKVKCPFSVRGLLTVAME